MCKLKRKQLILLVLLSLFIYKFCSVYLVFPVTKIIGESFAYHISLNTIKQINNDLSNLNNTPLHFPLLLLGLGTAKSGTAFTSSLLCSGIYINGKIDPSLLINSNNTISYVCRENNAKAEFGHFWERCSINYHPIASFIISNILDLFDMDKINSIKGMKNCSYIYFIHQFIADNIKYINNHKLKYNILSNISTIKYFGNNKIVLTEKSSSYFFNYNIAFLMTYYANFFPLKFYVVLRNPIKRIWSEFWAICRDYKDLRTQTNICKLNESNMNNMIEYELNNFQYTNPDYYNIFNILNGSNYNYNYTVNKIINVMKYSTYQPYQFQNKIALDRPSFLSTMTIHPFMKSCYFVSLIIWYKLFNDNNIHNMSNIFKIIPSEYLYNNPYNVQWKLKCWGYYGNDFDLDSNKNKCLNNINHITTNTNIRKTKYNSATSNNVLSNKLNIRLHKLLNGCIKCFGNFVLQNANIILGQNVSFVDWI